MIKIYTFYHKYFSYGQTNTPKEVDYEKFWDSYENDNEREDIHNNFFYIKLTPYFYKKNK